MTTDQTVSTIVIVDSPDVAGSVGVQGFLTVHLQPMEDTHLAVETTTIEPARCDVIAQQLTGTAPAIDDVPAGLEAWATTMTERIDIPETTSLFIMSMSHTVSAEVRRHATTGTLVQPPSDFRTSWNADQLSWIDTAFAPAPIPSDQIADALRAIAGHLEPSGADLVIFNTSTFIPDEKVYWFREGEPETLSIRAARTNLTVDMLIRDLDISLIDVDRITAEIGAGEAVTAAVTYTDDTLGYLAQEAITTILDLEGISELFASDAMQLTVPRYDRRTDRAKLTRWHVQPGMDVAKGDALFDLRFGNLHASLDNDGRETDKAISMEVVAGRGGFVESISVDAGTELDVGTRVGVITSSGDITYDNVDKAAHFPVGVKVEVRG